MQHQVELDFPWTRLVHLDLLDRAVNPILPRQILAQAPNLIHCRLYNMTGHVLRVGGFCCRMTWLS